MVSLKPPPQRSHQPPRRLFALPFPHRQNLNHVRRYIHRRRLPVHNRPMPASLLALCNTARSRVTTRRLRRNDWRSCSPCNRERRREGDGKVNADSENQAAHFGCGSTPPIWATKTGRLLPSVQIWRIWPKLATGCDSSDFAGCTLATATGCPPIGRQIV